MTRHFPPFCLLSPAAGGEGRGGVGDSGDVYIYERNHPNPPSPPPCPSWGVAT